MNAAIIGYGKMGREIERLLVERGHGVGLIVDADNRGDLDAAHLRGIDVALRSEERRVGKECRSRWSPYH